MIEYAVYNANGEIIRTGICQDDALHDQCGVGEVAMIASAVDTVHYVQNGSIVERPTFEVDVKNGLISSVPYGTNVYRDGVNVGKCYSGTILVEKVDSADSAIITLSLFPYLDRSILI